MDMHLYIPIVYTTGVAGTVDLQNSALYQKHTEIATSIRATQFSNTPHSGELQKWVTSSSYKELHRTEEYIKANQFLKIQWGDKARGIDFDNTNR